MFRQLKRNLVSQAGNGITGPNAMCRMSEV